MIPGMKLWPFGKAVVRYATAAPYPQWTGNRWLILKNYMKVALALILSKLPRGGFRLIRMLDIGNARIRTDVGYLYCDLNQTVCYPLLKYGTYPHAAKEFDLFRSRIGPDDVVYDVGANVGYTARLFDKCGARVVAFEPSPRAFDILARNCRDSAGIQTHNVAASDADGHVYFEECDALDTSHVAASGLRIEARRIDGFEPLPTFLKIDVEGHEPAVLNGATKFLQAGIPIFFEALTEDVLKECERIILRENTSYRITRIEGCNYLAEMA